MPAENITSIYWSKMTRMTISSGFRIKKRGKKRAEKKGTNNSEYQPIAQ